MDAALRWFCFYAATTCSQLQSHLDWKLNDLKSSEPPTTRPTTCTARRGSWRSIIQRLALHAIILDGSADVPADPQTRASCSSGTWETRPPGRRQGVRSHLRGRESP